MAKTYGTVTTFTAGSVLTAAQLNVASTAVNNLVVPAMVKVYRSTNLSSYTNQAAISWSASDTTSDNDGMWNASTPTYVTVQTTGLYLIGFVSYVTATATVTRVRGGILKNGSAVLEMENTGTSTDAFINVSGLLYLTSGDQIGARVTFTGGSAYILGGNASETNGQTRLTLSWVGRNS